MQRRGASSDRRHCSAPTIHEERLFALLLLVDAFRREDEAGKRAIYDFYLANTQFINNWDLVDCLRRADRRRLAAGAEQKPADQAGAFQVTLGASHRHCRDARRFIRAGELGETFRIADILMRDAHDLIHKATGWMLREAGKRDVAALRSFSSTRHIRMPRTMLRYAIERLPEKERRQYVGNKATRVSYDGSTPTASRPARTRGKSAGRSTKSSVPRKSASLKRKPNP